MILLLSRFLIANFLDLNIKIQPNIDTTHEFCTLGQVEFRHYYVLHVRSKLWKMTLQQQVMGLGPG